MPGLLSIFSIKERKSIHWIVYQGAPKLQACQTKQERIMMKPTRWMLEYVPFVRDASDLPRVVVGAVISLSGACVLLSSAFFGVPPIV